MRKGFAEPRRGQGRRRQAYGHPDHPHDQMARLPLPAAQNPGSVNSIARERILSRYFRAACGDKKAGGAGKTQDTQWL